MIKAGTIWEADGHSVKWLKDMKFGDPITPDCLTVDGQRPSGNLPWWVGEMLAKRDKQSVAG